MNKLEEISHKSIFALWKEDWDAAVAEVCGRSSDTAEELTSSSSAKRILNSYTCKNCNGQINPKTLRCEYCDTQY